MKRWQVLLIAGWSVYAISFFLPVSDGRGWEAFLFALGLLPAPDFGNPELRTQTFLSTTPWAFSSGVTNVAMLVSPLAWWSGKRKALKVLLIALLVALVLNLQWVIQAAPEGALGDLQIGYYAWWSSFATVAAGVVLRYRDTFPGAVGAPRGTTGEAA